jgi:hypothetical protein
MSKYSKPKWAIQQVTKASGLVEDICKHGIGHPNREWLKEHDPKGNYGWGIHCCDGCCNINKVKEI